MGDYCKVRCLYRGVLVVMSNVGLATIHVEHSGQASFSTCILYFGQWQALIYEN